MKKEILFDCKQEGCGKCRVCKYLDFKEYAESVAPPGSYISSDREIETYLKENYTTS